MKKAVKYGIIIVLIIIIAAVILFTMTVETDEMDAMDNQTSNFTVVDTANNISEAQQKAKAENKSVFVVFESDSCSYCKQLKEDTLNDAKIIDKLNDKYVTTIVNIDKHPDVAEQFNVYATPVMVFLDPDGNEQQRLDGYYGPEELLEYM